MDFKSKEPVFMFMRKGEVACTNGTAEDIKNFQTWLSNRRTDSDGLEYEYDIFDMEKDKLTNY